MASTPLGKHNVFKTEAGRARLIRDGHLPEREVMTAIGHIAVRHPHERDRAATVGLLADCATS